MINNIKLRLLLVLAAISCMGTFTGVQAQTNTNTISTGVPFLLIGPNSRFAGMGETGTAIADDPTAMHWNPAGLAFQTQPGYEFSITHSPWLAALNTGDLFYDYLAGRKYIKSLQGTVGMSITYLNIGEIIFVDESGREDPSKNYKAYEFAVALGYGTQLSKSFGLGVTTRFIFSKLSVESSLVGGEQGSGTGFAPSFDLAALYKPVKGPNFLKNKFSAGINLSNLGPKISYVDAAQADPLPTQLRLGLAYELVKNEGNSLTITADFSKLLVNRERNTLDSTRSDVDPFYKAIFTSWKGGIGEIAKTVQTSVGFEYWYGKPRLIALRGGFFYEDPSYGNRKFYTLGAGLRYDIYGFDFSYLSTIEENHPLANTLRFGIIVNFGSGKQTTSRQKFSSL